jgi:hypothetical protein
VTLCLGKAKAKEAVNVRGVIPVHEANTMYRLLANEAATGVRPRDAARVTGSTVKQNRDHL